ncbi:hypothetical protein TNCV_5039751 [Trichonephila clavipes]|nr:hypothetical protein TNCV_5039751 [Trichonephila clavipes]
MDLVPKMPAFLDKQAQLSTKHANETRLVTDSWLSCLEFESSTPESHHVEGLLHVKSIEAQAFSRWCGVGSNRWESHLRCHSRPSTMA